MKNLLDKLAQNPHIEDAAGNTVAVGVDQFGNANAAIGAAMSGAAGASQNIGYWPGSSLSAQDISQILQGITIGLSKEEQVELSQLQAEYTTEIKKNKLAVFKKLPADLRQFVANALAWREHTEEINLVSVEKSERLKQLEGKNAYGGMFGHGSATAQWYKHSTSSHIDGVDAMIASIQLPFGITSDELKQAHMEATLEEEMLNVKE